MRNHLSLLLLFLVLSLAACQTTSNSKTWKWQTISHQDSFITVISDTFSVGKVSLKEGLSSRTDFIKLFYGHKEVGGVELKTVTEQNYCGWGYDAIDKMFEAGGYIDKYLAKTGLSHSDVKIKFTRNKHGNFDYVDLNGVNNRCILTAQLTGAVTSDRCGGDGVLRVAICNNSSEAKANLDRQVFSLLDTLRLDGSGKELIKDGPVTVGRSRRGMGYYTDEVVCQFATDRSGQTLKWDTANSSVSRYLDEAKRRGLKVADCLKHLNIKVATPAATSASTIPPQSPSKASIEKRLQELKKLLDGGLITPGEAAGKRKKILENL